MNSLASFIGLRFSRSRRTSGFVSFSTISSMIGIAVGVMALTIGLSAMNGFEHELEDRVLSVVPQVEVTTRSGYLAGYDDYGDMLLENPRITACAPFVKVNALLQRKSSFKSIQIKGIDPARETSVVGIDRYITPGALDTLNEKGNLIIGNSIAEKYGISVGDTVSFMVAPRGSFSDGKIAAATNHSFTVTGLFRMSGQLDSLTAFINIEDAAEILKLPEDSVEGLSVRTTDFLNSQQIVLSQARTYPKPVLVGSWMYTQGHLYRDIQMVRLIVYISLFIVIAVACFNIVSSLMMALNDKRSSIAILMTMGATRCLIARIFIVMGMINGALGVVSGLALGFIISSNLKEIFRFVEDLTGKTLLSRDLHFIDFIPSEIHGADFAVAGAGALFICLLATLYPAYKAGRTLPALELSRGK